MEVKEINQYDSLFRPQIHGLPIEKLNADNAIKIVFLGGRDENYLSPYSVPF